MSLSKPHRNQILKDCKQYFARSERPFLDALKNGDIDELNFIWELYKTLPDSLHCDNLWDIFNRYGGQFPAKSWCWIFENLVYKTQHVYDVCFEDVEYDFFQKMLDGFDLFIQQGHVKIASGSRDLEDVLEFFMSCERKEYAVVKLHDLIFKYKDIYKSEYERIKNWLNDYEEEYGE